MSKRYEVWRHHVLVGTMTFAQVREYLLANVDEWLHEDLRRARRGITKGYCLKRKSLSEIASISEWCSVSPVRPRVWEAPYTLASVDAVMAVIRQRAAKAINYVQTRIGDYQPE